MNPDSNRFEPLSVTQHNADLLKQLEQKMQETRAALVRPDGSLVPPHWSVFTVGEQVAIKNYTFKVAYIGESAILFEPVGPVIIQGENKDNEDK